MNTRLLPIALTTALAFGAAVGCRQSPPPDPPKVPAASLDRPLVTLLETSRQAVVTAPKSAAAWGRLGQAFHAVDFFPEARVCYAQAARLDSKNPRWPHLHGLLQLQDEPDAAIENLSRAAKLAGTEPDAPLVQLGRALVERGRFDEAEKRLKVLLDANPSHAAARLEMGRVLLSRNELDRAAEALAPCATNYFTARPALLLLAQIRQRQGQAASAAELTQRAAAMPKQFDWPDPWLRETMALRVDRAKLADQVNNLLIQQRLQDAEAALTRLLNVFPNEPESLLLLGRLRSLQQRHIEAEEALQRHLGMQPSSVHGYVQLGICILRQKRWAEASRVLRMGIALKPDFAQAHYNLAFAYSQMGNSTNAIASYREALRCAPGDPNTHIALADELHRAGQTAEALQHLDRAGELNPGDPRVKELRELLRR